MQQAFIQVFGLLLQQQDPAGAEAAPGPGRALGRYPLRPLGSAKPSTEELTATVARWAEREKGQR
jgi:hypothetical protein